jgi:ubiquinone/menaquinone biosynthesis C-methylase UbiE
MKTQKEIFKSTEGDEWFNRNKTSYGRTSENLIVDLLKRIELTPKSVLEIGCSNGFRLNQLKEEFGCRCFGIDPSSKAIKDGTTRYPGITLGVGTADDLHYDNDSFDTVVFGFCLCLCDRKDLFRIAYEVDRVLQNEGTLVIADFFPPFPFKNRYSHYEGIYTYKMDYGRMFTWNPAYTVVANVVYSHSGYKLRDVPNERVATLVLRKNEQYAFPEEPYRNHA